jgi:hypothetical protein
LNYTKICTKCGVEKIAEGNFHKDGTKKDGYYSSCNICHSAYMKQHLSKEGDRINREDREARARLRKTSWEDLNTYYHYDEKSNLVMYNKNNLPLAVSSGSVYDTYHLPEFISDCQVHRLHWMMTHKYWAKILDHINGNKKDNRLENLRGCSSRENSTNLPRHRDGGLPGAHFREDRNYWMSYTRDKNGKRIYFKSCKTEREASLQYCRYAIRNALVRREFLPDIFTDEELGI